MQYNFNKLLNYSNNIRYLLIILYQKKIKIKIYPELN